MRTTTKVTINLPTTLVKKIETVANKTKLKKSTIYQWALDDFLKKLL